MSTITAIEMANQASVNPKSYRAALRIENFPWHDPHKRWIVLRGSTEHAEMLRVLNQLCAQQH